MSVRNFATLTNVSVKGGVFSVGAGASVAEKNLDTVDSGMSVIETKHGLLTATNDDGIYDFTALSGGVFAFTDKDSASVGAFDGSGVAYGIEVSVDASGNTKALKEVLTGSGKDVVKVVSVNSGNFDLGAGKDSIYFGDGSTATVSLGEGADYISVGASTVTVSDYNYADGDKISVGGAGASVAGFDYDNGVATVAASNVSVIATTTLNNGVYELDLNDDVFVRTNVSSVDYVATKAIDFVSNGDTTDLNLTLAGAGNDTNSVSVGATEGTVSITAGKAKASIDVGADVDFSLGIGRKGAAVTVKNVLDADDTLYLVDGSKISDVKFNNTDGGLQYGTASVAGAYNSTVEGTFKYNINGEKGVLAYGKNGGAVTYADGVTYYANAATVDASEYEGDVILNLNGVCGDAFNDNVSVVSGVVSGLVAGRDKKNTIISLETEAGNKTEVYGGVAGHDSIDLTGVDVDSTNVIWYSNGDGNDTVNGFTKGDNTVYFYDAAAAAGVLNDVASMVGANLKIAMDKKNALTLNGVKAATGETNVVNFKDLAGNTFNVAVGDGTDVTYNSEVNIYKGANTLKVDGEGDKTIWTGARNDEYGYYDGIKAIDARDASGTLYLCGTDVNGMSITGGTGVNHMWGGGKNGQTMVGNDDAVDVFWFGIGDGHDVANNAGEDDRVKLWNVENINDVVIKTGSSYFTVTIGNDSLKVSLAAGTTAEDALKTFTFANNADVLYTYDTASKKFQQK